MGGRTFQSCVFFADMFFPDEVAGFAIEAMRPTIGADGVDAAGVDDGSGGGAGAAFGIIGPLAVGFIVSELPEDFSVCFVETMETLASGGLHEFDIKNI